MNAVGPSGIGNAIMRGLARIARSQWLASVIVAIVAGAFGLLPVVLGKAQPASFHDEFSYLLAGETFARGRLTNPAPPADVAPALETVHVIVRPTYMSKFPPGQGLALAAGIVIANRAIIGAIAS